MKIYTKTGDSGTTGLIGGNRVSKAGLRIVAIGEVDEANAAFGAVKNAPEEVQAWIPWIQSRLFDVGADLATPPTSRFAKVRITPATAAQLEESIDAMDARLPPLVNFILPTGSEPACRLHLARSVTRRAERAIVAIDKTGQGEVQPDLLVFVNRLSDWAFTAARFANLELGFEEVPWKGEGKE